MSKCEIDITFDRPERTYRGGEEVAGAVELRVFEEVRSDRVLLETYWQTHGKGNTATGPKETTVLSEGPLAAGTSHRWPFRFIAPYGPPTYHGNYLHVDHYVEARVSIPWAVDPKRVEDYLLLPGDRAYSPLLPPKR